LFSDEISIQRSSAFLVVIHDLGSPGECDAGPALFLIFGRHRYVIVWDYLVLIG
jgi:hypothetical protein